MKFNNLLINEAIESKFNCLFILENAIAPEEIAIKFKDSFQKKLNEVITTNEKLVNTELIIGDEAFNNEEVEITINDQEILQDQVSAPLTHINIDKKELNCVTKKDIKQSDLEVSEPKCNLLEANLNEEIEPIFLNDKEKDEDIKPLEDKSAENITSKDIISIYTISAPNVVIVNNNNTETISFKEEPSLISKEKLVKNHTLNIDIESTDKMAPNTEITNKPVNEFLDNTKEDISVFLVNLNGIYMRSNNENTFFKANKDSLQEKLTNIIMDAVKTEKSCEDMVINLSPENLGSLEINIKKVDGEIQLIFNAKEPTAEIIIKNFLPLLQANLSLHNVNHSIFFSPIERKGIKKENKDDTSSDKKDKKKIEKAKNSI